MFNNKERLFIKNGMIYDGSGSPPFPGNLFIEGNRIQAVGRHLSTPEDCRVLDAEGLCVSPGFIDPHSHHDYIFVYEKENAGALTQGVTTQIVGLCGLGPVPSGSNDIHRQTDDFQQQKVSFSGGQGDMRLYSGIFGKWDGKTSGWETLTDYLREASGARINVAAAVSHCALRNVCADRIVGQKGGYDAERTGVMCRMLDELLQQGAVGFSTGLDYYPARLSTTRELIELCSVVSKRDKVFLIHTRPFAAEYEPMEEVFEISKQSGVKTHVLHTKTYYPGNCGNPQAILKPFENAIAEGCSVTSELYPYHSFASYAMAFLPTWALEGDYETVMATLTSPSLRNRLVEETAQGYLDFMIGATPAIFTNVGGHPECAGTSFDQIARLRGQSIGEMIVDLLAESRLEVCMRSSEPEEETVRKTLQDDFMTLLSHPIYMVGSDAIDVGALPHPRAWGSIAKTIRLWQEYGLPLEQLIYKLTAFPAQRFSLKDRGLLKVGKAADVVIFDPKAVFERASYEEPRKAAEGIRYVLINGQWALWDGAVTETFAGESLT